MLSAPNDPSPRALIAPPSASPSPPRDSEPLKKQPRDDHDGNLHNASHEHGEWVNLHGDDSDPEETRVMYCALDSFA
jgi:hypothetical protein